MESLNEMGGRRNIFTIIRLFQSQQDNGTLLGATTVTQPQYLMDAAIKVHDSSVSGGVVGLFIVSSRADPGAKNN